MRKSLREDANWRHLLQLLLLLTLLWSKQGEVRNCQKPQLRLQLTLNGYKTGIPVFGRPVILYFPSTPVVWPLSRCTNQTWPPHHLTLSHWVIWWMWLSVNRVTKYWPYHHFSDNHLHHSLLFSLTHHQSYYIITNDAPSSPMHLHSSIAILSRGINTGISIPFRCQSHIGWGWGSGNLCKGHQKHHLLVLRK